MYAPDTILVLKEKRSTKKDPFPYDRVRVIGQSPMNHALRSEAWAGNNGQGVLLTPLSGFGSTLDEPYGKVQRLYDVESVPVVEVPIVGTVEIRSSEEAGPAPEDVFSTLAEAEGQDTRKGRPGRKPVVSPLDGEAQGVDVAPDPSPLGEQEPSDAGTQIPPEDQGPVSPL